MDWQTEGKDTRNGKYLAYWHQQAGHWALPAFKWVPRPAGDVSFALGPALVPKRAVGASRKTLAEYQASLDSVGRLGFR